MKSNYTGVWMLITCAFVIVSFISFSDDISFGDWTVKKAPIAETLFPNITDENSVENCYLAFRDSSTRIPSRIQPIRVDSAPKSILLFGDSMTLNLAYRLSKYAKQNGHNLHSINWDSSNTKIWAETDTLSYYLNKYKPDYIFISLGSNEVYFKNPDKRLPYVKKILATIGDIPYVWIGPPNWNEDTKINDMIESVCVPGSFFRSQGMEFKRKKDNIHPTRDSSAKWMDSIMRWMPKSAHPILADVPSDTIKNVPNKVIFLKALH